MLKSDRNSQHNTTKCYYNYDICSNALTSAGAKKV